MQTAGAPPETSFGLCRLVGQIRTELVFGIEAALVDAGVDLNFSQFLALKHLGENDPMAPGELARHLKYNPGALTRLLDKLERLGYLHRVPDPNDRRSLRLELTAAGADIRTRMLACGNAVAERAFADVSEAEQHVLHNLLLHVLEHLRAERSQRAGT